MKTNTKKDKGFTSVDLAISVIILIIFVSIMTSVSYSTYVASTEAKRTAVALNYAVDIFECIGAMQFSNVTESKVINELSSLDMTIESSTSSGGTKGKIGTSYDYTLKIENKYNEVKLVTLEITYKVSANNTETLKMKRVKTSA